MAHKLDELKQYETFDPKDVGFDVEHIPEQIIRTQKSLKAWKLPERYKKITNILVIGMGGSHLPANLLQGLIDERGKHPLEIRSGYHLPSYVDSKTLVVAISYSGGTEETIEVLKQARKQKAKIVTITTGGVVAKAAKKYKEPYILVEPGDVVHTARLGTGLLLAALMHTLQEAKCIRMTRKENEQLIDAMIDVIDTCAIEIPAKENPAKQLGEVVAGKPVLIFSAEHLAGCGLFMQHQLEEAAKLHARSLAVPEMNHHFLESLVHPEDFLEGWVAICLQSEKYHTRNKKRMDLTAKLLENQGVEVIEYQANGKEILDEIGEVLQFSSYATYYAAIASDIETGNMPFVAEFKKKLG